MFLVTKDGVSICYFFNVAFTCYGPCILCSDFKKSIQYSTILDNIKLLKTIIKTWLFKIIRTDFTLAPN